MNISLFYVQKELTVSDDELSYIMDFRVVLTFYRCQRVWLFNNKIQL